MVVKKPGQQQMSTLSVYTKKRELSAQNRELSPQNREPSAQHRELSAHTSELSAQSTQCPEAIVQVAAKV